MRPEDSRLAFTAAACLLAGGILGRIFFPDSPGRPAEDRPKPVDVTTLLPNPLKTENDILRNRLTLAESSRFERDHGLTSAFDNCEDKDGGMRCTASKPDGTLVTYHCDAERCVMDCSK